MEKQKYLNEEKYQRTKKKLKRIALAILLIGIFIIWFNNQVEIKYIKNGTYEKNIEVSFKHRFINLEKDIECNLSNDYTTINSKVENGSCILSVPEGTYELVLKNKYGAIILQSRPKLQPISIKNFNNFPEKHFKA